MIGTHARDRAMIDTHAHYYGEALFARLAARAAVPRVERDGAARVMVTPTSRFVLAGGFLHLAERLAWMDGQGIATQVITFPGALGPDVLPVAEAVPLVRDVNDELAAVCAAHPGRFVALAGLPLAGLDAALAELERAVAGLGLRGVILPANYVLDLAGLARVAPLLAAAARLGAQVMVHPGQRHDEDLAPRHWADLGIHRASTIELHNELSHATLTLLHARLPERFPGLTVQVVNLGGAFPMLVERMDHIAAVRAPEAPRPSALLGPLWVDTASLGPRAIELAVAVFGAERVMLGTDYPIFATGVSTAAVAQARLSPAEREAVARGTAARLFGVPAA
jgi:predicted TIM-barrel fold metal-dependent hydrolase